MTGKLAMVTLLLGLFLVACAPPEVEQDLQVTPISAGGSVSQPTEVPTQRPMPTITAPPLPSRTPTTVPTVPPIETPTSTPRSTKTQTATPTRMPKATVSPTSENTPVPTPLLANTPAPDSTLPPQPTAIATTEEVEEIVVYYISNPNDILGVFPVQAFNANALVNNMIRIRNSLQAMSATIDGAHNGDAAACDTYVAAYNNILYSGVFFDGVPSEWQESDAAYFLSFIYSLDRTRPAYLSCVDAGTVDDFNYGLAVQTLAETLSYLNPYVEPAAARL